MSDFFESKYQRPVFSPVINITKSVEKPTFVSEIGQEQKQDMFMGAENVKKLMKEEKLSLAETGQRLGIDPREVANKLRLLEFSQAEREALINNGYDEEQALMFLQLCKKTRLYAMEYCRQENLDTRGIEEYVKQAIHGTKAERKSTFEVNDIGFVVNSLKKTVSLAQKMGFEAQLEKCEDEDYHLITVKVKKKHCIG